jgi:hypothetical protein
MFNRTKRSLTLFKPLIDQQKIQHKTLSNPEFSGELYDIHWDTGVVELYKAKLFKSRQTGQWWFSERGKPYKIWSEQAAQHIKRTMEQTKEWPTYKREGDTLIPNGEWGSGYPGMPSPQEMDEIQVELNRRKIERKNESNKIIGTTFNTDGKMTFKAELTKPKDSQFWLLEGKEISEDEVDYMIEGMITLNDIQYIKDIDVEYNQPIKPKR